MFSLSSFGPAATSLAAIDKAGASARLWRRQRFVIDRTVHQHQRQLAYGQDQYLNRPRRASSAIGRPTSRLKQAGVAPGPRWLKRAVWRSILESAGPSAPI